MLYREILRHYGLCKDRIYQRLKEWRPDKEDEYDFDPLDSGANYELI